MSIPHAVLAAGWIPFVVIVVLTIIFSFLYIRYFQSKYDSEFSSTIASILGLAVALLTAALVPVDIFLVSYMKYGNGTYKPWANDSATRQSLEQSVLYAYYALYACVMTFVFIILPFVYFYYEEGDDETSTKSRLCSAFKFTAVFVIVAAVLMLIGAFGIKAHTPHSNSTEWERIEYIFKEIGDHGGQDAISFTISSLTLLGMVAAILYTGYGMSAWPMDLIKGRRSATKERMEVVQDRSQIKEQIEDIRRKYRPGKRMSSRDRQKIEDLQEAERTMERREQHLEASENSCINKCLLLFRPFQIVFGIVGLLLTLLVFLSLLLTNIDKIMHSLGYRFGYALPKHELPNPLDITLVFAQKVFPVDYILIIGLIMFMFFCSMGGLQHMGIWCCCFRMYKIRVRRTKPQGLLFLCFILMFIVLALNVFIYQITPQYSTFGNQHYATVNNSTGTTIIKQCDASAPVGQCQMTQMSMLLTRFIYKVWFFGVCYFYASWAFLAVILLGFIVTLVKKRRSSVEGAVDEDDLEESDDENLINA